MGVLCALCNGVHFPFAIALLCMFRLDPIVRMRFAVLSFIACAVCVES